MEVVILAAGKGTRTGGQGGIPHMSYLPKPLLPLNGETIIERQVRLLKELGQDNIQVVAGENKKDIQAKLGNTVQYMETNTNHKNALYELAEVCKVTREKQCLLALLGDTIFSLKALSKMVSEEEGGITVFGSRPLHELGLRKEQVWWNRGDEIFAVKLKEFYIKLGRTLFSAMPDLYYELKNIPKQLNLKVVPVEECCDIDTTPDYTHVLLTLHKVALNRVRWKREGI